MHRKDQMLRELEVLLREMLEMRYRGGDHARLAHAQGLVDGYMRALLEGGLATQGELLSVVRDQRAAMDGPPVRELQPDEIDSTVAA
jgi:hypothetical protein